MAKVQLIVLDFIYLVILIRRYKITPKLRLLHPDGCGGLKPFGEFAKIAYYFLFIHTVALATIAASSDSFTLLRRIDQNVSTILQLLLVLVFFPLITGWLAYSFLYIPHQKLEQLKQKYLDEISRIMTQRKEDAISAAREITTATQTNAEQSEADQPIKSDQKKITKASDDDLIKTYNQIREIPSWPITKGFFKRTF